MSEVAGFTSCRRWPDLPHVGGGRIYLIILEIVLPPNLHVERLLTPLSFSQIHVLCSTTALSQVLLGLPLFLVPISLKSNALFRM